MAMQLLEPFAIDGLREDFDINPSPENDMSINKGFTPLFQIRPEEGGKFIDMLKFNQLLYLMSKANVEFTTQSFPNWIDDKGDGLPYAYPKNAIVKATDGEIYVSLIDDNEDNPISSANWKKINIQDFITINDAKEFDIGVNQTWQDVSASRSSGVTYTNNTGKPIAVMIYFSTGQGFEVEGYINNVLCYGAAIPAGTGNETSTCTLIIPNGATYKIEDIIRANKVWTELR